MPQGLVQPSRGILHSGKPVYREYEICTAANCYPGRLVIHDTNEWDVKVCTSGATNCIGVLDVEPTEIYTTIYGAGDQARVITGDCVVLLQVDVDCPAIDVGDDLIPYDEGQVQKGTTAGAVIGYALQASAHASADRILVKLTGV